MSTVREILIAGLGSVGRRHYRNLCTLGWDGVRFSRTGTSTLTDCEVGAAVEHDLAAALARQPLAVVVANPSAPHFAGMRDHLTHAYFGVDLGLAWRVIERDLHPLDAAVAELFNTSTGP